MPDLKKLYRDIKRDTDGYINESENDFVKKWTGSEDKLYDQLATDIPGFKESVSKDGYAKTAGKSKRNMLGSFDQATGVDDIQATGPIANPKKALKSPKIKTPDSRAAAGAPAQDDAVLFKATDIGSDQSDSRRRSLVDRVNAVGKYDDNMDPNTTVHDFVANSKDVRNKRQLGDDPGLSDTTKEKVFFNSTAEGMDDYVIVNKATQHRIKNELNKEFGSGAVDNYERKIAVLSDAIEKLDIDDKSPEAVARRNDVSRQYEKLKKDNKALIESENFGKLSSLKTNLYGVEDAMKELEAGTPEYQKYKADLKAIQKNVDNENWDLKGVSDMVGRFTASAFARAAESVGYAFESDLLIQAGEGIQESNPTASRNQRQFVDHTATINGKEYLVDPEKRQILAKIDKNGNLADLPEGAVTAVPSGVEINKSYNAGGLGVSLANVAADMAILSLVTRGIGTPAGGLLGRASVANKVGKFSKYLNTEEKIRNKVNSLSGILAAGVQVQPDLVKRAMDDGLSIDEALMSKVVGGTLYGLVSRINPVEYKMFDKAFGGTSEAFSKSMGKYLSGELKTIDVLKRVGAKQLRGTLGENLEEVVLEPLVDEAMSAANSVRFGTKYESQFPDLIESLNTMAVTTLFAGLAEGVQGDYTKSSMIKSSLTSLMADPKASLDTLEDLKLASPASFTPNLDKIKGILEEVDATGSELSKEDKAKLGGLLYQRTMVEQGKTKIADNAVTAYKYDENISKVDDEIRKLLSGKKDDTTQPAAGASTSAVTRDAADTKETSENKAPKASSKLSEDGNTLVDTSEDGTEVTYRKKGNTNRWEAITKDENGEVIKDEDGNEIVSPVPVALIRPKIEAAKQAAAEEQAKADTKATAKYSEEKADLIKRANKSNASESDLDTVIEAVGDIIDEGTTIEEVQKALGEASVKTTANSKLSHIRKVLGDKLSEEALGAIKTMMNDGSKGNLGLLDLQDILQLHTNNQAGRTKLKEQAKATEKVISDKTTTLSKDIADLNKQKSSLDKQRKGFLAKEGAANQKKALELTAEIEKLNATISGKKTELSEINKKRDIKAKTKNSSKVEVTEADNIRAEIATIDKQLAKVSKDKKASIKETEGYDPAAPSKTTIKLTAKERELNERKAELNSQLDDSEESIENPTEEMTSSSTYPEKAKPTKKRSNFSFKAGTKVTMPTGEATYLGKSIGPDGRVFHTFKTDKGFNVKFYEDKHSDSLTQIVDAANANASNSAKTFLRMSAAAMAEPAADKSSSIGRALSEMFKRWKYKTFVKRLNKAFPGVKVVLDNTRSQAILGLKPLQERLDLLKDALEAVRVEETTIEERGVKYSNGDMTSYTDEDFEALTEIGGEIANISAEIADLTEQIAAFSTGKTPGKVRPLHGSNNSVVYGFYDDDSKTIYLDEARMSKDTAVHEFSHVWNIYTRAMYPMLYKRGLELVNGSDYHKKVLKNPAYNGLSAEKILDEALAMAIEDAGNAFLKKEEASTFKSWLKELFNKIGEQLGFTKSAVTSSKSLGEMSLGDFVNGASREILKGEKISGIDIGLALEAGNEIFDPLFRRVENERNRGLRMSAVVSEESSIKSNAISNGTFMKAPNGKPTNLNEKQWVQVRTQAFKNWFGDWEDIDGGGFIPNIKYSGKTPNKDVGQTLSEFLHRNSTKESIQADIQHDIDILEREQLAQTKFEKFENLIKDSLDKSVFVGVISEFMEDALLYSDATVESINKAAQEAKSILDEDGSINQSKINKGQILDTENSISLPGFERFAKDNPEYEGVFRDWEKLFLDTINISLEEKKGFRSYSVGPLKAALDYLNNNDISVENVNTDGTVSKVVDKNGEPLVVYHGTKKFGFDEFIQKQGSKGKSKMQLLFGNHFASSKDDAALYATDKGGIYDAFLNVKRPIDLSKGYAEKGDGWFYTYLELAEALNLNKRFKNVIDYSLFTPEGNDGGQSNEPQRVFISQHHLDQYPPSKVYDALVKMGFDGVIYNPYQPMGFNTFSKFSQSYISFNPNQVKSATDNDGAFSKSSNNIRMSAAPNLVKARAELDEIYNYIPTALPYDMEDGNKLLSLGTQLMSDFSDKDSVFKSQAEITKAILEADLPESVKNEYNTTLNKYNKAERKFKNLNFRDKKKELSYEEVVNNSLELQRELLTDLSAGSKYSPVQLINDFYQWAKSGVAAFGDMVNHYRKVISSSVLSTIASPINIKELTGPNDLYYNDNVDTISALLSVSFAEKGAILPEAVVDRAIDIWTKLGRPNLIVDSEVTQEYSDENTRSWTIPNNDLPDTSKVPTLGNITNTTEFIKELSKAFLYHVDPNIFSKEGNLMSNEAADHAIRSVEPLITDFIFTGAPIDQIRLGGINNTSEGKPLYNNRTVDLDKLNSILKTTASQDQTPKRTSFIRFSKRGADPTSNNPYDLLDTYLQDRIAQGLKPEYSTITNGAGLFDAGITVEYVRARYANLKAESPQQAYEDLSEIIDLPSLKGKSFDEVLAKGAAIANRNMTASGKTVTPEMLSEQKANDTTGFYKALETVLDTLGPRGYKAVVHDSFDSYANDIESAGFDISNALNNNVLVLGNTIHVLNKPEQTLPAFLKANNIEGGLLNEEAVRELQKEIEANYVNPGATEYFDRFGKSNDIRQQAFNYDTPFAQGNINGVDVRIAGGLIEETAEGSRRMSYLLYADGKIVGKFYSVSDAKKVVEFISDNLINPQNEINQTSSEKSNALLIQQGDKIDSQGTNPVAGNETRRAEVKSALTKLRDEGLLRTSDKTLIGKAKKLVGVKSAPMTDAEIDVQMALLDAMADVWAKTTGNDNFYDTFIADVKKGDLSELTKKGGALFQDVENPKRPISRVTLAIFDAPQFEKMKGQQVVPQTISDLVKGRGKQIEKDIINMVLEFDKFKGQKRISFDEFRNDVEVQIMKLEKIYTDSYASYGMGNLGSGYGSAKTVILNSPITHGDTGHFNSAFVAEGLDKTEWELKQIPNTDNWVAMDKNMPEGVTADNIAGYVGTAGAKTDVEKWILDRNKETSTGINKGMFGHIRKWVDSSSGIFHIAEIQSDYYQKHKASELIKPPVPEEEIDAHMNKNVWHPLDKELANQIKEEWGITSDTDGEYFYAYDEKGNKLSQLLITSPLGGLDRGDFESVLIYTEGIKALADRTTFDEKLPDGTYRVTYSRPAVDVDGGIALFDDEKLASAFIRSYDGRFNDANEAYKLYKKTYNDNRTKLRQTEEQKFIQKRQEELSKDIVPNIQLKQFVASQKAFELRILREAIKMAAEEGSATLRLPDPYTIAVIEGYVDSEGNAPYEIIDGDSDRLYAGDIIDYVGTRMTVVESTGDTITVAPSDEVNYFRLDEYISDEVSNRLSEIEYEAKKHFDNLDNITREEVDNYEPDEWMADKAKELLEEYFELNEDEGTVKWDKISTKLEDHISENYNDMDLDDLIGWAGMVWQDGNSVFVIGGGNYEALNQPDGYEGSYDKENYYDELSKEQQTVVDKYEELGKQFQKMRPDARVVEDENGFNWLETDITESDRNNPIIAFQEEGGKVKGAIDFTNENKATIHIFDGADISTLAHEMSGHLGRRVLEKLAEANPEFAKQYEDVKKWAGVKDVWTRKSEEKFARGFEKYLRYGDAPIPSLKEVFSKLKEWLTSIYKTIKGSSIDVKLTDDVIKTFDSLLGTNPAVDTKVIGADGNMMELYHQTDDVSFTKDKGKYGGAIFFSTEPQTFLQRKNTVRAYVLAKKIFSTYSSEATLTGAYGDKTGIAGVDKIPQSIFSSLKKVISDNIDDIIKKWKENNTDSIEDVRGHLENKGIKNASDLDLVVEYLENWNDGWSVLEHPTIIEFIKNNGYDSFITKEEGVTNIAVMDKSQVVFSDRGKSIPTQKTNIDKLTSETKVKTTVLTMTDNPMLFAPVIKLVLGKDATVETIQETIQSDEFIQALNNLPKESKAQLLDIIAGIYEDNFKSSGMFDTSSADAFLKEIARVAAKSKDLPIMLVNHGEVEQVPVTRESSIRFSKEQNAPINRRSTELDKIKQLIAKHPKIHPSVWGSLLSIPNAEGQLPLTGNAIKDITSYARTTYKGVISSKSNASKNFEKVLTESALINEILDQTAGQIGSSLILTQDWLKSVDGVNEDGVFEGASPTVGKFTILEVINQMRAKETYTTQNAMETADLINHEKAVTKEQVVGLGIALADMRAAIENYRDRVDDDPSNSTIVGEYVALVKHYKVMHNAFMKKGSETGGMLSIFRRQVVKVIEQDPSFLKRTIVEMEGIKGKANAVAEVGALADDVAAKEAIVDAFNTDTMSNSIMNLSDEIFKIIKTNKDNVNPKDISVDDLINIYISFAADNKGDTKRYSKVLNTGSRLRMSATSNAGPQPSIQVNAQNKALFDLGQALILQNPDRVLSFEDLTELIKAKLGSFGRNITAEEVRMAFALQNPKTALTTIDIHKKQISDIKRQANIIDKLRSLLEGMLLDTSTVTVNTPAGDVIFYQVPMSVDSYTNKWVQEKMVNGVLTEVEATKEEQVLIQKKVDQIGVTINDSKHTGGVDTLFIRVQENGKGHWADAKTLLPATESQKAIIAKQIKNDTSASRLGLPTLNKGAVIFSPTGDKLYFHINKEGKWLTESDSNDGTLREANPEELALIQTEIHSKSKYSDIQTTLAQLLKHSSHMGVTSGLTEQAIFMNHIVTIQEELPHALSGLVIDDFVISKMLERVANMKTIAQLDNIEAKIKALNENIKILTENKDSSKVLKILTAASAAPKPWESRALTDAKMKLKEAQAMLNKAVAKHTDFKEKKWGLRALKLITNTFKTVTASADASAIGIQSALVNRNLLAFDVKKGINSLINGGPLSDFISPLQRRALKGSKLAFTSFNPKNGVAKAQHDFEDLKNHPYYPDMVRAGLAISDPSLADDPSEDLFREDLFDEAFAFLQSSIDKRTTGGVKKVLSIVNSIATQKWLKQASEASYLSVLNNQRAGMFIAYMDYQKAIGAPITPKGLEITARAINDLTMKSSTLFGYNVNKYLEVAGFVLWAPRMYLAATKAIPNTLFKSFQGGKSWVKQRELEGEVSKLNRVKSALSTPASSRLPEDNEVIQNYINSNNLITVPDSELLKGVEAALLTKRNAYAEQVGKTNALGYAVKQHFYSLGYLVGLTYAVSALIKRFCDDPESTKVGLNPLEGNFLKVGCGGIYRDFTGNISGYVKMASKFMAKLYEAATGTIIMGGNTRFNEQTAADIAKEFYGNKLSPSFSTTLGLILNSDFYDNPIYGPIMDQPSARDAVFNATKYALLNTTPLVSRELLDFNNANGTILNQTYLDNMSTLDGNPYLQGIAYPGTALLTMMGATLKEEYSRDIKDVVKVKAAKYGLKIDWDFFDIPKEIEPPFHVRLTEKDAGDGMSQADRYIYNKINKKVFERTEKYIRNYLEGKDISKAKTDEAFVEATKDFVKKTQVAVIQEMKNNGERWYYQNAYRNAIHDVMVKTNPKAFDTTVTKWGKEINPDYNKGSFPGDSPGGLYRMGATDAQIKEIEELTIKKMKDFGFVKYGAEPKKVEYPKYK